MPKPLKEYVQQVLAEHNRGHKIREALFHAHEAVKAIPDSGSWRRKSTRRGLFWEKAVEKLIELVADDPNVQIVPHYDTVSFIFDDDVLVRLKKAGVSLATSNYPTPLADLFDDHQVDLFGYGGLQRVEAVYVPSKFESSILWAGVVARENNAHTWHFELEAPIAVPVIPLPMPLQPSAADLAKVKDQAKPADQKKNDDGKP